MARLVDSTEKEMVTFRISAYLLESHKKFEGESDHMRYEEGEGKRALCLLTLEADNTHAFLVCLL